MKAKGYMITIIGYDHLCPREENLSFNNIYIIKYGRFNKKNAYNKACKYRYLMFMYFFVVLGGLYFLNLFNITGNRIAV
jgi:hypothetical protein